MDGKRLLAVAALLMFAVAAMAIAMAKPAFEPEASLPRIDRVALVALARAGDRLLAAGERGRIVYSDDAGTTWHLASAPSYQPVTSLAVVDGRTLFATAHQGAILRSTDAGATWQAATVAGGIRHALFALHVAEGHGVAVGAYGAYLESSDGGRTWTPRPILAGDFDRHLTGIAGCGGDCLVIAGEAGTLLRSTDAGLSWRPLTSPYAGSFFGAVGLKDGTVMVYGMRGHAFRSDDRGRTWKAVDLKGYTGALQGASEDAEGRVTLVGADGFLASSRDGGLTFLAVTLRGRPTVSAALRVGNRQLYAGPAGLRWAY